MGVFKKILIGLGSLFLVLVVLFGWIGVQSVRFKRAETPFVKAYVTDLSRHWNVADVYNRSANAFIEQAVSVEGQRTIQGFKSLGTLTAINDLELKNYSDGTWGHRGVFDFKADFQNGEALVELIVVDDGRAGPRVLGMHFTSMQMNPSAGGKLST